MTLSSYQNLIASKGVKFEPRGFKDVPELHASMFPHQAHSTDFALRQGCSALFLDTGLGKSLCALEWARVVVEKTNKPVLMLAPLAVGPQHQREAEKFGIAAKYIREPSEITGPGTWITNYERLEKFNADEFSGVVLDESSILKSFTGATTQKLIATFGKTPYRLACTATPAPNDHTELGNHAQFLGAMESREMLSRWFINDTSEASQSWRLKGHAAASFWDWVASWARCIARPSDLGFDDAGFDLPDLVETLHEVMADRSIDAGEFLFRQPSNSATSLHKEKRLTLDLRAAAVAAAVSKAKDEAWIIWVDTDYEADAIKDVMPGAVEVRGSMPLEKKEERLIAFQTGEIKHLVSKPRICGYGLNWQHCHNMAFTGLSFSYEAYYQAIRRCWRFGQSKPVNVHIAIADTERSILDAIRRKQADHGAMKDAMSMAMMRAYQKSQSKIGYQPVANVGVPSWLAA